MEASAPWDTTVLEPRHGLCRVLPARSTMLLNNLLVNAVHPASTAAKLPVTFALTPCPSGHYCPEGTRFDSEFPCPLGTFNNNTGAGDASACTACSPGKYCPFAGMTTPEGDCAPGWYCTGGSSSATPLPGGNSTAVSIVNCTTISQCSCPNINVTGGRCPPGHYCPAGSSAPIPCPPGFFCTEFGLSSTSGPCTQGYHCPGKNTSPQPSWSLCPEGHFCPTGMPTPLPCPLGTFSAHRGNANETDCTSCSRGYFCNSSGLVAPSAPCESGFFCPSGQKESRPPQFICPVGHFCVSGSPAADPCPLNTYQPSSGKSSCLPCPSGHSCLESNGTVSPSACLRSFHCGLGVTPLPCPEGTFSNRTDLENATQCDPCSGGWFCPTSGRSQPTGLCTAGHFCSSGAKTSKPRDGVTGDICPPGSFCPEGSVAPRLCPSGTFSNTSGLVNSSQCSPCSPGDYCDSPGLTTPTGPCVAGYYCSLGAEVDRPSQGFTGGPCPDGHYCPLGSSTPTACPPGTFRNTTLGTSLSSCQSCRPGQFCLRPGQSDTTGPCQAGFYCTSGARSPTPVDNSTGAVCPVGHYCPTGSSQPRLCQPGLFTNSSGMATCLPCPEAHFCRGGSHVGVCTAGYFCPQGTGTSLKPCPIGTFSNLGGLSRESQCQPCLPGAFCSRPGSVNTTGSCPAGYYCQSGVDSSSLSTSFNGTGGTCPPGTYCPTGTSRPIPCPSGMYNEFSAKSSCTVCRAGFYCPSNSSDFSPYPCPSGHYCPTGTALPRQFPCPPGTFNNQTRQEDLSSCTLCSPGQFCKGHGLSTPTGPCSAGWYCELASASPTPTSDNTSVTDFAILQRCPLQPFNQSGGLCPAGFFCPEGSSSPQACTAGQHCNASGLASPSGPCHAGFFCAGMATQPDPVACLPGYFCPSGTQTQLPCPPGRLRSASGGRALSDCDLCTAGSYCSDWAATNTSGHCSPGYYCPPGQNSSTPSQYNCPPGHYCPPRCTNTTRLSTRHFPVQLSSPQLQCVSTSLLLQFRSCYRRDDSRIVFQQLRRNRTARALPARIVLSSWNCVWPRLPLSTGNVQQSKWLAFCTAVRAVRRRTVLLRSRKHRFDRALCRWTSLLQWLFFSNSV